MLALDYLLESSDSFLDWHDDARYSCKLLCHVEWLRQETLNTSRSRHDELVVLAQLLHTEDCDNILKLFVSLQKDFHSFCCLIVLLAYHVRVKDS